MALAVANVLDPRFKRKIVEFYLKKLYRNSYQVEVDKFHIVIKKMYRFYATTAPSTSISRAFADAVAVDQIRDNIDEELDSFLYDNETSGLGEESNELDKYPAEPSVNLPKALSIHLMFWLGGKI